jgi:hypothetical protein
MLRSRVSLFTSRVFILLLLQGFVDSNNPMIPYYGTEPALGIEFTYPFYIETHQAGPRRNH